MIGKYRFWEIDFVRGLAIIGMVIYHLLVDLFFFHHTDLNPFSYPILFLAHLTAATFLYLVGFSFSLSLEKFDSHHRLVFFKHTLQRAFRIFLAAILVMVFTFLISPDYTVRFGILHLISLSLILLLPFIFISNRALLIPLSFLIIFVGVYLKLYLPGYTTFDFYPIFPWFGVVLFGFATTQKYSEKRPTFPDPNIITEFLSFLGRHSLFIYLIHQPIILSLLYLTR